jgi:hypothetical protein
MNTMQKWNDGKNFYVIFDTINEMVNHLRVAEKNSVNSNFYPQRASRETDDPDWAGTDTYTEADDVALYGWGEGYEKMMAELPKIKVKATATDRKHYERMHVEGFVPCVPRAIEGHPESMINAIKLPMKHKIINVIVNVCGSACYTADAFVKRGGFISRLIDEIETKGYRINLWVAEGSSDGTERLCTMVKIKASTEMLSQKRIAYPIGHPSLLRRHFFRVLETQNMQGRWYGYGHPDDDVVKGYAKKNFDSFLYIPTLNAISITDYQDYIEALYKYNDNFKLD